MQEEEELQTQIEELRARRREQIKEDEPSKKEEGIGGVFTFQAILAVTISILYVLSLSVWRTETIEVKEQLKTLMAEDFSFQEQVYETVSEVITYLNELVPIEQNGQGGSFQSIENNQLPENITLAPVIYTGDILYPINGGRITAEFDFRTNPIYQKPEFHNAMDIAAPEGTSIYAAASGTVIKSEEDKSLGNYIKINHGNGFVTTYGHCSRLIAKEGMIIRKGEVIAKVGSTGDSTGPHVHFSSQMNGLYFNPRYLFDSYRALEL